MMQALGAALRWTLFTAAMAAATHFATLIVVPGLLMAQAMANAQSGVGVNAMAFPARGDGHGLASARRELLIATCVFNLSQNAVSLSIPIPGTGNWSVTMYGEDARPFFFDQTRPGEDRMLNAVLVEPGGAAPELGKTTLIKAPSFTGLVVIRSLIENPQSLAENDRVRHQASCQAIPR